MTKEKRSFAPPTHAEIAAYAYQLWEADGRRHGRDIDYWLQAQAHLTADRKYEAGLLPEQSAPIVPAAPKSEPSSIAGKSFGKPEKRRKIEIGASAAADKQSAFA